MAGKPDQSTEILDAVALLVVDMQPRMFDAIDDAEAVCARCGLAIEAARMLGIKVVFTEQVPDKLGAMDPRLRALAPKAPVFAKNSFSALLAPGLQDHLKEHGVYHLLLAGIETSVCVYQTALHAIDFEFDVTVLTDCVTGRRTADSRVVLRSLERANCHVLPAETVFYSMLATSSHPKFRAFTHIVKHYAEPEPWAKQPQAPSASRTGQPADDSDGAPAAVGFKSRRGGRRRRKTSTKKDTAADRNRTPDFDGTQAQPQARPASEKTGTDAASTAEETAATTRPRRRRGGTRRGRSAKAAGTAKVPSPAQT